MSDTEYISKDAFVAQRRKQYCVNCERRKNKKNGKKIFVYDIGEAPCRACYIGDMIDAVWDFPPADVAPVVHGQWENIKSAKNTIRCSNCGHIRELKHFGEIIKRPVFCEMCGAKMDESEGENNG